MATNYDSVLTYDGMGPYNFSIDSGTVNRDLFIFRNTDSVFNCQGLTTTGLPLDLTNHTLSMVISEYFNGITLLYAEVSKTFPVDGMYQINISDTLSFVKNRYVYSVFAVSGSDKIKIQQGQIIVT